MARAIILPDVLPDTFEGLCRLHWPRPIHDGIDYENALEVVDRLALLVERTRDQEDYLEVVSTLVEKYDRDHFPAENEGGGAARLLKYLMEGRGMSASDLGRVLGNRTLGPAILRGERKVSKANALKLAEYFKVSPALFLQP